MKLAGQTAIVTGASRGIGRAIALACAESGADVIVNYAGSQQMADELVERIRALGRQSIAVQADASAESGAATLVEAALSLNGRIDLLVNNAGITRDALLMRMKEEDWDDVIRVNLKSVFLCTKAVSRQMMKQRAGAIVNIASIVGVAGNAGQANYVAAKAGVIGLTKTAAKELAPRGIRVNAIAPGFIETDMTASLPENIKEQMRAQIPLGSFGTPAQVAAAALFLASDDASYMTGQTIHIDGGMVM